MKISVLLAALLLLFSCTDKDSKQSQDLIVKTAQAVSASGIKTTEFPFIAQPFRTSELSFRVGGPIDRLDVYAGNHYKQGSIIAEIDPRDFHIRKERAEAIYHQAKAEFERIRSCMRRIMFRRVHMKRLRRIILLPKLLSIRLPMNWETLV